MLSVDETEIRKLQWWHDHHKGNVIYLIKLIDELLAGKEHSRGILEGAMVGYREMYLTKETRVSESESEAKATN